MGAKWLARAVEMLRDHPVFDVPDPESKEASFETPLLAPADREEHWNQETLRLFRRRASVISLAVAASIAPFWVFYTTIAPEATNTITLVQGLLLVCCALINIRMRHVTSLRTARDLTMAIYVAVSLTAAAIMGAARDPRASALSGHGQIVVSLLFMPFSFAEAAFCALIVTASFAVGLASSLTDGNWSVLWPRVASIALSGGLMAVMAHLQSLIRRRAFDSAFDMALSANRGALLSNIDAVTGGFNRRHLVNMLELELARSTRFGQPLSLLMFDLDNFKIVNDTNGHPAGDEVLREVFSASVNALRGIDTIARYGGDEFTAILPGTDRESAKLAAHRLQEAVTSSLKKRFPVDSLESGVTLSIGVACLAPGENVDVAQALGMVDLSLYQAKRDGKNRVAVFAGNEQMRPQKHETM